VGRSAAAVVLGGLLLLLLWAVWLADSRAFEIFWGVLGLGAALASLVNWLRGPSVRCHLTTELQTVQLRSLNRRPRAERVLGPIEARIRQAQAALPSSKTRLPEVEGEAEQVPSLAAQPLETHTERSSKPPLLPSTYNGFWHWLFFALLLLCGAVTYWQLQTDSRTPDIVGTILFLATLAIVFIAIHRQRTLVVAQPVRIITWSAMALMLILLVATWVTTMYTAFAQALETASAGGGLVDPIAFQVQAGPMGWLSFVGTTTIGLAGLVVMSSVRLRTRASRLG